MSQYIKLIINAILIAAVFCTAKVQAQKIQLDRVAKIELTTIGSFVDRHYRKVEVVVENNSWNSYQTRHYMQPYLKPLINDSSRTLIKSISPAILDQFLTVISNPDTVINAEQFNIDTQRLAHYIDTVIPDLQPQQKVEFIKLLNSKGYSARTVGKSH